MIRRLVLRSLRHRPGRSLLLLAGYALGVGVTVALLSIGSALVQGSRDRTLVGGGDLTVLPAGLDLETFRTGGASSLFFSIDQAPFLHRQVLAGPRFSDRVAAAAPWIDEEVLYLELPAGRGSSDRRGRRGAGSEEERVGARGGDERVHPVSAGGRIPGLSLRLGAPAEVVAGGWRDAPADLRWTRPDDSTLYAGLDAFHLPPPGAAGDSSWAEWHYFNVLLPEGRGWLYLTFMVAGEVPDGRWGGRMLGTLVTRRDGGGPGAAAGSGRGGAEGSEDDDRYRTLQFRRDLPAREVGFSLARPDLRIGDATVTLGPEGRYRLRAEIPPASGAERRDGGAGTSRAGSSGLPLRVEMTLEGDRRSYLPPLDVAPGGFTSGYVVPMLDARADGRVCLGDACRQLDGTRAYHDHNWGRWSGVTWDWGHARAGSVRLLYGGVRRDGPTAARPGSARSREGADAPYAPPTAGAATAGRRFLFVTDSLGFAGLFTIDRLEHRWRKSPGSRAAPWAEPVPGPGRRPRGLTVEAVRGRDTVRLRATVQHAGSTRRDAPSADPERPLLFWQMRGAARVEGRLLGRSLAGTGDGFFETWAAGAAPDDGGDR